MPSIFTHPVGGELQISMNSGVLSGSDTIAVCATSSFFSFM